MPAEIVTMADCASNYGVYLVRSSGKRAGRQFYTVTFHGSEGPAHCTCPAYQFSTDRSCKHITRVWEQACFYNPQWNAGRADPKMRPKEYTYDAFIHSEACPACGGPVVAVRRAV